MSEHQSWHHHGAHCLNRAANWVLVELAIAGKPRSSLKADDPLIEKGVAAVKKLATARGVPAAEVSATHEDLLLTVQAVAEGEPDEPARGAQGAARAAQGAEGAESHPVAEGRQRATDSKRT